MERKGVVLIWALAIGAILRDTQKKKRGSGYFSTPGVRGTKGAAEKKRRRFVWVAEEGTGLGKKVGTQKRWGTSGGGQRMEKAGKDERGRGARFKAYFGAGHELKRICPS